MISTKVYVCTVLGFVGFILQIRLGSGELRFCLGGPQRMRDDDCPGGFVFKEGAKPTCKFYAKTGNQTNIVLSAPLDVCDDNSARAIEAEDDLADIESLTWLMWEDYEVNDTMGTFPENICQEECLPDYEGENMYPDDDPIPEDFDPTSELKKKFLEFNQGMFLRMLMDENDKGPFTVAFPPTPPGGQPLPPVPETPQDAQLSNLQKAETSLIILTPKDSSKPHLVKLLARSFKVALSLCAPYVHEDFYEQVLKGIIFITNTFQGEILDLSTDLYNGIARILDHCALKHQQDFVLNGTGCAGREKVDGIFYTKTKRYWPHRATGRSFRWGMYHPIIDAAWTTLDLIQSFCYESFMKNMMLSHVFYTSIEQLFTPEIQLIWFK